MRRSPPLTKLHLLPMSSAIFVFSLSFILCFIWFAFPGLKEFSTGSMKVNTTLALMASSYALWLLRKHHFKSRQVFIASSFVLSVGGLTFLEYLTGMNIGIDELLVKDFPSSESLLFPGRMSPIAALGIVLFSLGCLGTISESRLIKSFTEWAWPLLSIITMFSLVGYIYGEETFYKIGPFIRIAWQTALCLFLLSLGAIFARPNEGPGQFLSSPGMGGIIARRLLPIMVVTQVVLGLAWLYVRRSDLISRELAISLFVITVVLIMIVTLRYAAFKINHLEALGLRTSEEGKKVQQKFQDVMDNSPIIVWSTDLDGNYTLVEGKSLMQLGVRGENLLGKNHFVVHANNPLNLENVKRALAGESFVSQSEDEGRYYTTSFVPNRNAFGEITGMSAVSTDITEQRIAEKVVEESEANLRFALEAGEMGTWGVELSTGKVSLSEESQRLFGFNKKNALDVNNTIEAVIHPEDRSRAREELQEAIARNKLYRSEYRIIRPIDGELRWILATGKGREEAGGVKILTGVIMDITDQIQSRLALEESEAKFRTIADAMPQMVWSTLPDGYHDYYNKRWYEFTGVPEGSTDGEAWNDMFHSGDQEKSLKVWKHSLETGEPYEIEYRLRHHSGEFRWVLGRALPIKNAEGRIIRWMGTCTDIHDQKLVEEHLVKERKQLETLSTELKESVRSRDEFLSIASHELKTPLTSLLLQSQVLMRAHQKDPNQPIDSAKAQNFIRLTEKQVKRLTRLVDDMLDVSRIRTGKLSLERETMSLDDLVSEVLERMKTQFEAAGYTLPSVPHCEDTTGDWDRMRIEQVLLNLLTNAIRYGLKKPIEVHCEALPDTVRLLIKDHGIGIAPEDQDIIFDRFERGIDASEVSGLGLGLFITKQIVISHRGKVWVESKLGEGSTFFVELPRKF